MEARIDNTAGSNEPSSACSWAHLFPRTGAGLLVVANSRSTPPTVRFRDYSRMPSNRIPSNPLKTLARKFSTREKIRLSRFTFISLFGPDVTMLHAADRASMAPHRPVTSDFFSTRVSRKESRKSSRISKAAKIGRHTFECLPHPGEALSKQLLKMRITMLSQERHLLSRSKSNRCARICGL